MRAAFHFLAGLFAFSLPVISSAQTPSAPPPAIRPDDEKEAKDRARDAAIEAKLDNEMPNAKFEDQPFEQVLDHLKDFLGVNMHVHWDDLVNNGVDKAKAISIDVKKLPAHRVLRLVLDEASDETRLGYEVRDGVLLIATQEKLMKDCVTRVYPIRDILTAMARRLERQHTLGVVAENQSLSPAERLVKAIDTQERERLAQQAGNPTAQPVAAAEPREAFVALAEEELGELLRQTLYPDEWIETGAGQGTIRFANGAMVVRQSRIVHRELERVLGDLRKAGAADTPARR